MKRWMFAVLVATVAAGCSSDDPEPTESQSGELAPGESTEFSAPATENLSGESPDTETFTYVPEYIEIDRLAGGTSSDFGDANLHRFSGTDAQLAACAPGGGADPADGSCDSRLPASNYAPCTNPLQVDACACTGDATLDTDTCVEVGFIDWNELLTNAAGFPNEDALNAHRLLDDVKTDVSSFKNGSCVTTTKVLGKMDLTAAVVANNSEYSYLALKRHDNNGDAGYVWIFTAIPPTLDASWGGCSDGEPLVYTLSQGDVLVVGNFNPSSGADLVVRRATAAADGHQLLAQDVVDPLGTIGSADIWEPIPGSSNLAAVNTTDAGVGVLEYIGGVDQAGNRTDRGAVSGSPGDYAVGPNIFAEAGIDFRVFTGDGSLCEQRFYGSVITQPSSSKTSDLKDLLGPQLFNFGSMQVEAEVAPSCDKEISYDVTYVSAPGVDSADPDTISGVVCTWTFTHESGAVRTANECDGVLTLDPADPTGEWTAEVDVSIASGVSCSSARTVGTVSVADPLEVTASTAPLCGLDFTYEGTVSGGSGAATSSWEFNGIGGSTATPTDDLSGSVTVTEAGTYSATLTVEDVRPDITCSADDASSVEVAESLAATATLTPSCGLDFDYDVAITGGLGTPTISWEFTGPGAATPGTSSTQSGGVTVDAAGTYSGTVEVTEVRGGQTCTVSSSATVDAFAPLEAGIDLTETCGLGFDYDSTAAGGSGDLALAWTFSGPGATTPSTASGASGSVGVGSSGAYTASLTVSDNRSDITTCELTVTKSIGVFDALQITKADLTPTCGLSFNYDGAFSGGSGSAVATWSFAGAGAVNPATTGSLSGSADVASGGSYTGTLSVTDTLPNGLNCTITSSDAVDAFEPLAVSVSTEDLCDSTFDYASVVTGGSGDVTLAWSFGGAGSVTPSSTDTGSGNAAVGVANADYTATLLVTDNRTDISCSASDAAGAHPLAPITVNITPGAASLACTDGNDSSFSDSITYVAHPGGGDGAYTYAWSGCVPSADGTSCVVDPNDSTFCADQDVQVVVDDGSTICAQQASETETYSKRTVVSSTDN